MLFRKISNYFKRMGINKNGVYVRWDGMYVSRKDKTLEINGDTYKLFNMYGEILRPSIREYIIGTKLAICPNCFKRFDRFELFDCMKYTPDVAVINKKIYRVYRVIDKCPHCGKMSYIISGIIPYTPSEDFGWTDKEG